MSVDIQEFHTFVHSIMQNDKDPYAVILNAYTTFLMRDIEKRKHIYDYRIKWFVDNYVNYDNIDKRPYYEYYKNNIQDCYHGIYDPPPCFYNEMIRDERRKQEEEQKECDHDMVLHYHCLSFRHLTKWDLLQMHQDTNECSSYIEDDIQSDDDTYDNDSYMTYDEYDDYDNYYDDYQSEYEEDDYDY
jgi:hypothetical protein